jgi:hypothetical protein
MSVSLRWWFQILVSPDFEKYRQWHQMMTNYENMASSQAEEFSPFSLVDSTQYQVDVKHCPLVDYSDSENECDEPLDQGK